MKGEYNMAEISYKPNSHKYKEAQKNAEETKRAEKVVKGTVRTRKKNELISSIIAEDAHNVGSFLLRDVAIPAIKNFIVDIVTDGINMLLKGTTSRRSGNGPSSYVSYNKSYSSRDDRSPGDGRTRTRYIDEDIILETRGEAEEVLERMDELLETYGVVRVADLYDLVGKTCDYTDNKYGWTNLRSAEPVRVPGGGYKLKLPKATALNQ